MTAPYREGLARFLAEEFGRQVEITWSAALSSGARRRNVAFDADLGDRVLELVATVVPPSVELLPVDAEAAVREVARQHSIPTPRVVACCADSRFLGAPFLLSERVEGETVPRRVLRVIRTAGLAERVANQLGEAMARLHAIDPAHAPSTLPGEPDADPARALLREIHEGVAALLADRPVFRHAVRWIERRIPEPPTRRSIIHTDLRVGNIVVGPDGLRAVLDWEGAQRFGDPMRDLAWPTLRMWRFGDDAREFGGLVDRAAFVTAYERAGGAFDLDRFRWWKTASTLAWGVLLAGQAAAYLDSDTRDIVMAAGGRRVSEIEWDLLMQIRPAS
ncbi:phosphotransferase family protein [Nocardia amikacinitolerans]|uniref:phosphotransferase family protein n=1 Tax=Nocardia amikacinitolerans TaxID=756689 RepID=UPI0020A2987D|nr:phosphotransferase family protein [Nocardia amikacinitolerans]MCP2275551.1 putative kinase, aminoglycoside phosphotransferase (APT) family [Nocardia amikacinitolerans]